MGILDKLTSLLDRFPPTFIIGYSLYSRLPFLLPHDKSYLIFPHFMKKGARGGTILDIGANNGISSAYFHKIRPDWKIIAFEPNGLHQSALERLKRKFKNFEYHLVGLSDQKQNATFYTPTWFGIPLHCETSTRKQSMEHFHDYYYGFVADRIKYQEHTAQVITLDELKLQPDVIKIDSEGEDLKILQGGIETLRRNRPYILLEDLEENYSDVVDFCNKLDMEVFFFDFQENLLIQSAESLAKDENHGRNLVVIPAEKLDEIQLPRHLLTPRI